MAARAELDLDSYDRLFPSQDFMPKGSFGNLIALPLQGESCRGGTTVFLDPVTMKPWPDQWAFLANLGRLSPEAVRSLVSTRKPVEAGPRARALVPRAGTRPPAEIRAELGSMLTIERFGLPPWLLSALKHLASLHNPEFYEKQRMRLSTWGTPRFIRCYLETLDRLLLPRGLGDAAERLVVEAGSRLVVTDQRPAFEPTELKFIGALTIPQERAVDDLAQHDLGMLVAPPGTGKTVMACALIARHAQPALVIVDRTPLLDQWRVRVCEHLGLASAQVGQLGGGKDRRVGIVDLAMAQTLARREDVEAITAGYGLVVVDECHHIPTVTFEACVRRIPARRWLGLTATPYRRDRLEGIMAMHCGPVRYHLERAAASEATPVLELVIHDSHHPSPEGDDTPIHQIFRDLVDDGPQRGDLPGRHGRARPGTQLPCADTVGRARRIAC